MTGPLRAAWALTVLVIVAGAVLWLTTGRTVFAVFIVLGLVTAVGAWFSGRAVPAPADSAAAEASEEEQQ